MHDDGFKAQYVLSQLSLTTRWELLSEEERSKYPYERDFIQFLEKLLDDLDKRYFSICDSVTKEVSLFLAMKILSPKIVVCLLLR